MTYPFTEVFGEYINNEAHREMLKNASFSGLTLNKEEKPSIENGKIKLTEQPIGKVFIYFEDATKQIDDPTPYSTPVASVPPRFTPQT